MLRVMITLAFKNVTYIDRTKHDPQHKSAWELEGDPKDIYNVPKMLGVL